MPKYDLDFQPAQRRRRDQVVRFLLGFGAVLLLLTVASAIALQQDGFLDNILDNNTTTQPEDYTEEPVWAHTGSATFLLSAHDNARQNLHFAILVQVELETREIRITPLNPRETTLVQGLRDGDLRGLQNAAEALTETRIDRYIATADSAFIRAINDMGSVTVQVEEGIRFRSPAFSLTLAQGTQRVQGDMLLRYFRYLGLNESTLPQQGELLKTVLETYLVPRNAETTAMLEQRFHALGNVLTTDISVADFFANRDMLMDLLAESEQIVIKVEGNQV